LFCCPETLAIAQQSNVKRFRPLSRPSSFLLVDAKRNRTKEKRLPDEANPASRSFRDFSTRHPGSVEKRRTSMCGALRVCDQRCVVT